MSHFDRLQDALSGYTGDYVREIGAQVPVCDAQAEWEAATRAEEDRQRQARIAARAPAEIAAIRDADTTDWPKVFARLAVEVRQIEALAKRHHYSAPWLAEMRELAERCLKHAVERKAAA